MRTILVVVALLLTLVPGGASAKMLVPMDLAQEDHLKAYGFAFWCLTQGTSVEWLLNYRGGSFLLEDADFLRRKAILMRVSTEEISPGEEASLRKTIEEENMEAVLLEKAPRVAIYTPPDLRALGRRRHAGAHLRRDATTDTRLRRGGARRASSSEYDWLHLHHEDFTGQYGTLLRRASGLGRLVQAAAGSL